jgi:cell division FtsZ-interacting protein ZapD
VAHANFSNFKVQRSRLSRRNFAADAEIFSAFGSLDLDDLERDLDTELNQHLRPRRNTKQVWKSVDEIDTDLRAAVSAAIGRHSPLLK